MTEPAKRSDGPMPARADGERANAKAHAEPQITPRQLSIGDLSREFRVSTRAIRFYESRGLLRPMRRGMTRVFTWADRQRLALIIRAKNLGLTLEEIAEHLAIYDGQPATPAQAAALRDRATAHIDALVSKRNDLQATLKELREIRARLTQPTVKGKTI